MLEIKFDPDNDDTQIGKLDVADTFIYDQSDRDLPDPFMVVDNPPVPGPRVDVYAVNLRTGLVHTFKKGTLVQEKDFTLYVKANIKEA